MPLTYTKTPREVNYEIVIPHTRNHSQKSICICTEEREGSMDAVFVPLSDVPQLIAILQEYLKDN